MISYRIAETGARGDNTAPRLAAALLAAGYSVFLDATSLGGGDLWDTTIQSAVDGCQALVAVVSHTYANSLLSVWSYRELVRADDLRKVIIPVWHSGEYPPREVAMRLATVEYVPKGSTPLAAGGPDLFEAAVQQLLAALQRRDIKPARPL